MSVAEMARVIGKIADLRIESFQVQINILDVKVSYGNTRYLVKPVAGSGEAWVDESRVSKIAEGV
jgi:hypothetical protein